MDILDLGPAVTNSVSYPSAKPARGSLTFDFSAPTTQIMAAEYRIPRLMALQPGELGFMKATADDLDFEHPRKLLANTGWFDVDLDISIPWRHWNFLTEILKNERQLMMPTAEAPDDTPYAYHGQYPESQIYWPCCGPICRAARNERVKSAPGYRARHTNPPRPQRQYRDTELLIFFAQIVVYSSWIECVPPETQTRLMKDMAGKTVKVWDLTPKEELMRSLFSKKPLEQYLLNNTRHG